MLKRPLFALLVFVPVTLWLGMTGASPTLVFICACLAILPLAGLMGEGTDHLTRHTGPGIGAVVSSSFGNAAELILGFIALREGHLAIVKASLTGSIIGNMLVVLGLSMLVGGWRKQELRFNQKSAQSASSVMFLAVIALVMPAIYAEVTDHQSPDHIESLSLDISFILIVTYAASLFFTLRSHRDLLAPHGDSRDAEEGPAWSVGRSLATLLAAAVGVAVIAELLIGAVEAAGETLGLRPVFMGVVVLALVGNAAENSTAIQMAARNKMDLSLNIAVGSSTQIAILVAPLLVIAGHLMGTPLGLEFTLLEVAAVMLSVMAVSFLIRDGSTNWFEGLQLLAIYAILAMVFYFI